MIRSGKPLLVDPDEHFSGWAYQIEPPHHSALGIRTRYVIDQEKTAPAREAAIILGMSKAEATARIKILRRETVIDPDPDYDFQEGDLFYKKAGPANAWVQVIGLVVIDDEQLLEAHIPHNGMRQAFHLPPHELAETLKSGDPPSPGRRIDTAQSRSDALRLSITTS